MNDEHDSNPDPGAAPSLVDPVTTDPAIAAGLERSKRLQEEEHDELRRQTIEAAVAAITACNEAAVASQAAAHRLRDREWLAVSGARASMLYSVAADAVRSLHLDATQQQITLVQLDALADATARLAELDKTEIAELSKAAHESELDYLGKREIAEAARRKAESFGKLGPGEKTIAMSMLGAASIWAVAKWMGKP